MFFGAGDVDVYINKKPVYGSIYDFEVNALNETEWILNARALDVEITVTCKATVQAPIEIVTSCLLAGLKNVADHWVYEAACARVESQFAFAVDRWIRPEISQVKSEHFETNGASFEVSIIPVIFTHLVGEPKMTAYHIEDTSEVRLELIVDCMSEKIKSSMAFSDELWYESGSECMKVAKQKFLQSLYDARPELSHMWSQIRYNWCNMQEMSPKSVAWLNKIQGGNTHWQTHKIKKQPLDFSSEDSRVEELPGLNEEVKHPETGKTMTLKSAIIMLNDSSKWTREQIADWLDTLDVDLQFKVRKNEQD